MPMADKRQEPETDRYVLRVPHPDPGSNAGQSFLEDSPEHAKTIAFLIAEWNALEQKLVYLTSLSMEVHRRVIIPMVYASDSSRTRLESIRGALAILFKDEPTQHAEMTEILDAAGGFLTQRNKYAHAVYGKSKQGELVLHNVREHTSDLVPLHDIQHQFERMKALSDRIGRLLARKMIEVQEAKKKLPRPGESAPQPRDA